MISIGECVSPAAPRIVLPLGGDDKPGQPNKDENSDVASSDNSEKKRRRRKLKRARRGKKAKGAVDDHLGASGFSSDEDQGDHGVSDHSSGKIVESGSDDGRGCGLQPTDESIVDAEVVSMLSNPFSFTNDVLPQYQAEQALGAHRPPVIIVTSPANEVLPHTDLETVEAGHVCEFPRRDCDAEGGSDAPLRCLKDSCCQMQHWVPAKRILREIKFGERSINSGSSKSEGSVELSVVSAAPGKKENAEEPHSEVLECPGSRTPEAMELWASQSMAAQALRILDEADTKITKPVQQVQDISSDRRLEEPDIQIATRSQEPLEGFVRDPTSHAIIQAAEPSAESSGILLQDRLQHHDRHVGEPNGTSSHIGDPRIVEDSSHQAVGLGQRSSEVVIRPDSEASVHATSKEHGQSAASLDSRVSQNVNFSFTTHHLGLVNHWLGQTDSTHPSHRLLCKLHEGYSAQEHYGIGPNVHWCPALREKLWFKGDWRPTHRWGTRRWSFSQDSDGSPVGVHTDVAESSLLPRAIYDRRIQRDEIRVAPIQILMQSVCRNHT